MSLHDRSWTWNPEWKEYPEDDSAGGFVHFRKEIDLDDCPSQPIYISITADTRYKLYINSKFVHYGPVKGDSQVYFPRLPQGGLRIQHTRDLNNPPTKFSIDTDESWETAVDVSSSLPILADDMFLHIFEEVNQRSDSTLQWISAQPHKIFTAFGLASPWRLSPRQIPFARLRLASFSAIHNVRSSSSSSTGNDAHPIRLPAGTTHHVELEASHHLTAFLAFRFVRSQTPGAELKITYSECYEDPPDSPHVRLKGDRRDISKKLIGPYDTFIFGGINSKRDEQSTTYHEAEDDIAIFEPLHFRTFRFIALDIKVPADSDLIFHGIQVTRTNYPLDIIAQFSPGAEVSALPIQKMWDTSILTLENYTRSSALFTYYLSGDDRLTRQAIVQIRNSFQPALGLTASRAPCEHLQIIPNFSLFCICMVTDHFLHYRDMAFTSEFLPIYDSVLDSFKRRLDPELGLVRCYETDDFWDFVDWTEAWKPLGIPPAGRCTGFQTLSSSLYAYTLQQLVPVLELSGRKGISQEYKERSVAVTASIRRHCFDDEFFTDGLASSAPQSDGAITGDAARNLLAKTLLRNDFTTPSIAMTYDAHFHNFWTPWIKQLSNNVTTWVEDNVSQRSDYHAWGSAPIYEFTAEVVGLKPLEPGWRSIAFKPRVSLFRTINSKVPIPIHGSSEMAIAHVRWERKPDDAVSVSMELKKGNESIDIPTMFSLPGGEEELVTSPFAREVRIV
ncbi:hypothetical protein DL95DRAFT_429820 [Leptodontidium sp. 2 PMI_412]|nr:hypothetical protein DL95DRAFT_429820 [Leptodontidium sp. 2 PMI_412]